MNFILPIILIASSVAVFFGYVDPNYKGTTTNNVSGNPKAGIIFLKEDLKKYDDILNSSTLVVEQRTKFVDKRASITQPDQIKLERLLPSNIDSIRLIIELKNIAAGRSLTIKNPSVGDTTKAGSSAIGPDNSTYGIVTLKFTVNASYPNFLNFLKDLESNLRLLDITDISFNSTDTGFYDFNVSLNTYWLK